MVKYETFNDEVNALERDEVDLSMASADLLLMITN
jgi:hypothetical protein